MGRHVVVGAGGVGRSVSRLLVADGHEVVLGSRSGSNAGLEGVEAVSVDVADTRALVRLAQGAAAIYNCVNPRAYHRWAQEWPPMAAGMLAAAEQTGAMLVITGNLYAYGAVDGPMTASTPLGATGKKGGIRRRMWLDALAAHEAGRVRVAEVRASDYVGPESGAQSHLGDRVIPRLLAGRRVRVLGSADVAHTWTYVPDVARTLVAVGAELSAGGRAWMVPSNPPMTQRQALASIGERAGVDAPKVSTLSKRLIRVTGTASPIIRELGEVLPQFERPFVVDASETVERFGIEPTPWIDVVDSVLDAYGVTTARV